MTDKQIIRNLRMYILGDIELEGLLKELYSDLERILGNLNRYNANDPDNGVIYNYENDNNIILFDYNSEHTIWIDTKYVWNYFNKKFDTISIKVMNYILMWYISFKYNLKVDYINNVDHNKFTYL